MVGLPFAAILLIFFSGVMMGVGTMLRGKMNYSRIEGPMNTIALRVANEQTAVLGILTFAGGGVGGLMHLIASQRLSQSVLFIAIALAVGIALLSLSGYLARRFL